MTVLTDKEITYRLKMAGLCGEKLAYIEEICHGYNEPITKGKVDILLSIYHLWQVQVGDTVLEDVVNEINYLFDMTEWDEHKLHWVLLEGGLRLVIAEPDIPAWLNKLKTVYDPLRLTRRYLVHYSYPDRWGVLSRKGLAIALSKLV